MVEIKNIDTARIDPKSTVNVRRNQVEEGVEKVKLSIKEQGFLRNFPITVRPHPDSSSEYEYEYEIVVGQCRLRACLELDLKQIPAFVQEINDDDAIRLSWGEGEHRTDLTMGDKVYWADYYFQKYLKQSKNKVESRRLAGKFLGVDPQTIVRWLPLTALTDDQVGLIDDKKLRIEDAAAVAQSCVDAKNDEEFEQKINERIEWIRPMNKRHKDAAQKLVKEVSIEASIEDLDKKLEDKLKKLTFEVTIPEGMRPRLIKWGDDAGLIGESESTIGSNMITRELLRK